MSLTVHAYRRDSSGSIQFIDEPPGTHVAGFESWRTKVYGSEYVRGLGARLLPLLAETDLFVETPAELDELEADCGLVLANVAEVASAAGDRPDRVALRIGNIQQAIERAREHDGYVVVW
jgi:hypothetical protein